MRTFEMRYFELRSKSFIYIPNYVSNAHIYIKLSSVHFELSLLHVWYNLNFNIQYGPKVSP